FPLATLKELKALPEIPDLALLLRQYASSLGRVHKQLRQRLEHSQARWSLLLKNAAAGWRESSREDDVDMGLSVVRIHQNGDQEELYGVYAALPERVETLQRRNHCATSLERAHFTSEVV